MEMNLLDKTLEKCQEEQAVVTITLQNKVRVHGKIKAFDSYVIILNNQKQEIVYRHCISCLSRYVPEVVKDASPPARTSPVKAISKPSKSPVHHHKAPPAPKIAAAANDSSINSGMKEGLLKWMQKQKAAK